MYELRPPAVGGRKAAALAQKRWAISSPSQAANVTISKAWANNIAEPRVTLMGWERHQRRYPIAAIVAIGYDYHRRRRLPTAIATIAAIITIMAASITIMAATIAAVAAGTPLPSRHSTEALLSPGCQPWWGGLHMRS